MAVAERAPTAAAVDDGAAGPARRPVLWWAAIGMAFLALQAWVFGSWILSGDARSIPAGPDPVPGATKAWAIGSQIVLSIGAVAVIGSVVRRCRREGRLTFDAVLLLGWASIFWGNPLENYTQVMRLANGYMVNLGSWIGHVPGVVSPTADRVPEPLVYMLALYFGYGALTTFAVSAAMGRATRRWPALRGGRLFLATWTGLFVVEIVVESLWARTEIMAYAGGIRGISLFAGHPAQMPLHIPLLVSLTLTLFAWIHHSPPTRAALFRGAERTGRPTLVRVLAMVGAANIVMLCYAVPAQWFALHPGPFPPYRSYLNNGVCGAEPGGLPCPGPGIPIFRRDR
jgi:hypothetical protein